MKNKRKRMKKRAGYWLIRGLNLVFETATTILLAIAVIYGMYAIWDTVDVTKTAAAVQYEKYKPKEDKKTFEELKAINPETIGWLTVYGTKIDYPMVQAEDNAKYLTTSAEGNYSLSGAIFLDYRCSPDMSDFNSIIHGHHMANSVMFGDIGKFKDREFFDTHEYGYLCCDGDREYGIEFYAFLEVDAYSTELFHVDDGMDEDFIEKYLEEIEESVVHRRDMEITPEDHIVLLSTCTEDITNGRHILVGRLCDEVFEDIYKTEEIVKQVSYVDIVNTEDQWVLGLMLVVVLLLVLLVMVSILINGHRRDQQEAYYDESLEMKKHGKRKRNGRKA